MTVTTPPPSPSPEEKPGKGDSTREVALWAAVTAFFTNLLAFKGLALLADGNTRLGLSALLTSIAVAGGIYARERLVTAREKRHKNDP
jgi:hypothetical protein